MKISRNLTFAFLILSFLGFCNSVQAKDEWLQIRSKNFFLIGNASEKDIRKVGTRLEEFREMFRLLFAGANLTSPIPTNVVVFKSDSYYKNFKPKRSDGKIDNFVAAYFQPGEDVNYITLSTEGDGSGNDTTKYSVIFHEYVHSIVNTNFGKSEIPAWFNEGLAEYYSTFEIEADQKVKLGLPLDRHLDLLQQNRLVPLDTLFKLSNAQWLETGSHSRSIYYAESWALIHYLIQSGKTAALGKFITLLTHNTAPEKAFQDAFQITYAEMEGDLKKYVSKSSYQFQTITLTHKLNFEAEMHASPLDEAATNAYLGDLLYHNNRADDSEPFLQTTLKLKPDSSMANTTLGMVKIKQRKFDDARKYLENAISEDQKNHMAFYQYAFLLSREGRDEFGYVRAFPKETADKIRIALRKAIAMKPEFTESYELMAFVDTVNNEELDEAAEMMKKALRFQPGNQRYAMRIAEIYSRQSKFAEAAAIVDKIVKTADDPALKQRAENLVSEIRQRQEFEKQMAGQKDGNIGGAGGRNLSHRVILHNSGGKPMSEAEILKAQADAKLLAINQFIRKSKPGEERIIGKIQKIDCKTRPLLYTIKTPTETLTLESQDFQALSINVFTETADNLQIGCGSDILALNAVITYRPLANTKTASRGDLVSIDFVPNDFRIMSNSELDQSASSTSISEDVSATSDFTGQPPPPRLTAGDSDDLRRNAMMQSIRDSLPTPSAGQKREMGYLNKIECTSKGIYMHFRTPTQTIRLLNSSPKTLSIRLFTPDLEGVNFGCTLKPIEFPAVFVYSDKPDAKAKTAGEIVSIDFVPKSFVLEEKTKP